MALANFAVACLIDDQSLIRVLYCKHTESKSKLQKHADPVAPNAREISVLVVDVSSDAITSFFSTELGVGLVDSIRFGRPFRTIIRNIGRIRDHLIKLEGLHG